MKGGGEGCASFEDDSRKCFLYVWCAAGGFVENEGTEGTEDGPHWGEESEANRILMDSNLRLRFSCERANCLGGKVGHK